MNELVYLLASPSLERAAEKRLVGKPYFRLGRLVFMVGSWVFQRGALLGYGLKNEPEILGKLLGSPSGEELSFVHSMRRDAETWLQEAPAYEFSLFQMYMSRELRLMGIDYAAWPPNKALERKCDPLEVDTLVRSAFKAGTAVGHVFPARFQACWENTFRIQPAQEWETARAAGLGLPEMQEESPLEEHLSVVLQITAAWASEYGAQRFSSDELAALARMAADTNRPPHS